MAVRVRRVVRLGVAAACVSILAGGVARADSKLDEARALYAAASYEEALQALDRAETAEPASIEAQEYRALCFLALGRSADATRTMEAMVTASPLAVHSSEELPPRFVTLLADTRKKLLPSIAKQLYAEARDQYKAEKRDAALEAFKRVLTLVDDPMLKSQADIADLKTLALGYVDLLQAKAEPAVQARAAAARTAPPPAAAALFVPATPIRQDLPAWVPPDVATASLDLHGAVTVKIGADGRVKGLNFEKRTHPAYDARLVDASREWVYTPATLNGKPIESERVLAIELKRTK
jgi:tetratricopeptide (TPR) repeat protein